ncbi:TolC family protein [Flavobacterium agricola]|uniref:TolC family protein n=1 Tax=Flavobacterium agricola TaxID=2870839 RepID=A0ABY6LWM9_9FLAO|nr:TolC family protein [Flavobacterium agricola]UYW00753.1 TolC family protein [Flavobacterium agricola]
MKNNFIFKSLFLGIFCFSGSTFAQNLWTLEQCVEHALVHNVSVQNTELEVKLAEIDRTGAKAAFLPSINASANHSWNVGLNQNITTGLLQNQTTQFSSAAIQAGVDIYRGLEKQYALRRSNLALHASKYQLQKMQDDVALNVINAYLQIVFNKENLRVQTQQHEYDKKQYERTKNLVEAGSLPKGDLLDISATVAKDEQNVITAENNLIISKISLAQLLQLEDFETFDIADQGHYAITESAVMLEEPAAIVKRAKETRAEIKIAETNIELASRDLKIARSRFQPTLQAYYNFNTRAAYSDRVVGYIPNATTPYSVVGTVQSTGENVIAPNFSPILGGPENIWKQFDNNKGHSYGLALSIPVFNGLSVRNNVERNKVNVKRAELNYELESQNLEKKVYTAYTDTKSALKAYEAAEQTLSFREQSLEYARERYEVGLLNVFDLTQVQTLHVNAQSEALRTKYDYIFKTKILEFYFGIPVTELTK